MATQKKKTAKKPIKLNKVLKKGVSAKSVKTMKLLAIVLVVLLLILIAAAQFGGVTLSTVSDYFASAMAKLGTGEGYPYSVNGTELDDVGLTNSDLVLVYDSNVKVLNSTAKEISNIAHDYDYPVISTNSGRVLLFDEGAKKFRVQSKTRVLYEKEMSHIILTGEMGKDGTVAIATRADNAESMLTVFDSSREEVFVWKCAKEHIVSCDVSDNGRNYVVAVLGVDNGAVYTKVHIFDKRKTEPVATFEYNDTAVANVKYLSNETVIVMGNNICEIIKGDKVKEQVDVSVNTTYQLFISDNNSAVLVLSKYSSTTQKIIKVYNKSGKELFTQEIDGMVKSVSTDGKYVSVLTNSNVQNFTMRGKPCGSAEVNADAEKVLVSSRNTYVYSSDAITLYSTVGDNKDKE